MTDDRWKRLLPLLRQQESIAQGEMLQIYYDYVFATLLQLARWQNSEAGAPIPDPELRDLVSELTGEAFVSAFGRIDDYDPDQARFPPGLSGTDGPNERHRRKRDRSRGPG